MDPPSASWSFVVCATDSSLNSGSHEGGRDRDRWAEVESELLRGVAWRREVEVEVVDQGFERSMKWDEMRINNYVHRRGRLELEKTVGRDVDGDENGGTDQRGL